MKSKNYWEKDEASVDPFDLPKRISKGIEVSAKKGAEDSTADSTVRYWRLSQVNESPPSSHCNNQRWRFISREQVSLSLTAAGVPQKRGVGLFYV